MSKFLILISGNVGTGKDTTADFIEGILFESQKSVFRMAMAESLKNFSVNLINYFFDLKEEKACTLEKLKELKDEKNVKLVGNDNTREFYDNLSKIIRQEFGEDFFPYMFLKKWDESYTEYSIIPDIRFNELESFVNLLQNRSDIQFVHLIIEGPTRERKYAKEYKITSLQDLNSGESIIIDNSKDFDYLRNQLEFLRPSE